MTYLCFVRALPYAIAVPPPFLGMVSTWIPRFAVGPPLQLPSMVYCLLMPLLFKDQWFVSPLLVDLFPHVPQPLADFGALARVCAFPLLIFSAGRFRWTAFVVSRRHCE